MEYQTIKEKGKVKFVVLPVELFETLLDRLEDESDIRAIREAEKEPLYDQEEAEEYIFLNPVKRERLERGFGFVVVVLAPDQVDVDRRARPDRE